MSNNGEPSLAKKYQNLTKLALGTNCFFHVDMYFPPNALLPNLERIWKLYQKDDLFDTLIQNIDIPNIRISKESETVNDPYNGIFHAIGAGVVQPADEVSIDFLIIDSIPISEFFFVPWLKTTQSMLEWPMRATIKVDVFNNRFDTRNPVKTYELFEVTPQAVDLPKLDHNKSADSNKTSTVRLQFNRLNVKVQGMNVFNPADPSKMSSDIDMSRSNVSNLYAEPSTPNKPSTIDTFGRETSDPRVLARGPQEEWTDAEREQYILYDYNVTGIDDHFEATTLWLEGFNTGLAGSNESLAAQKKMSADLNRHGTMTTNKDGSSAPGWPGADPAALS